MKLYINIYQENLNMTADTLVKDYKFYTSMLVANMHATDDRLHTLEIDLKVTGVTKLKVGAVDVYTHDKHEVN